MDELQSILNAVALREPTYKGGIGLASAYLTGMQTCLGSEVCARKFAGLWTPEEWSKALKDSAGTLVYRNEDMDVIEKAAAKTDGACMTFKCVLTSTRKDRDGDILESDGADVDPKMPLLWQHVPMLPIGKMTEKVSQTSRRIVVAGAIADTEQGNDAAQLAEFGALRISHGFRPIKFEPLKDKDEDGDFPARGFHVKQFEVMEFSLVSVPSNTDAVITAYSRQKLHHPLIKGWAEGLFKSRPATVKGGFDSGKNGVQVPAGATVQILFGSKSDKPACACGAGTEEKKSPEPKATDAAEKAGRLLLDLVNDQPIPRKLLKSLHQAIRARLKRKQQRKLERFVSALD